MTAAPERRDPFRTDPVRLALMSALVDGDLPAAYALTMRLLDDGTPFETIVERVLAPIQADLGRRWADGDISIADEHAATAVVEDLVTMLASGLAPTTGRSVVVVCPEGDDHTLPGRVVSLLLGLQGVTARFLGGSLPARDLGAYLETTAPFAVALSCSVPSALVGALRSIEVAHAHGIPVVVGGRAFGHDPTRSLRVGADAWAADAPAAHRIVTGWPDAGPVLAAPALPVPDVVDRLRSDRPLVVAGAIGEVAARVPALREAIDGLHRVEVELAALVDVAAAALLLDDPGVLAEQVEWVDRHYAAHGIPAATLDVSLQALAVAAEAQGYGVAAALLRSVG